jgi:hypothetical protein
LADSASLKITGQKLGLLTKKILYEMFEFGIRRGPSMIPHTYALANNCYFYDEKLGKTVKLSKEEAERKGIYREFFILLNMGFLDLQTFKGAALVVFCFCY